MLHYGEIISKLTVRQKLALLTDYKSLSDAEINRLGIPFLGVAGMGELNEGSAEPYPAARELINAWDGELSARVAENISAQSKSGEHWLVVTPDLRASIDPYEERLTEDPVLAGEFGKSIVSGIRRAGASVCLARRAVDETDAAFFDVEENLSEVREFLTYPFEIAAEETPADALAASLKRLKGKYADVNRKLARDVLGEERYLILSDVSHDQNCRPLLEGNVCLEGALLSLDTALGTYNRLTELIEEGSAAQKELDTALRDGSAIPEEALDEAVDRVIDFAFRCSRRTKNSAGREEDLALRAAESSIVLLKNRVALPLPQDVRVAVIGGVATQPEDGFAKRFSRTARDHGLQFIGKADGYDAESERSEELIPEAVKLAEEADVVLLFLGLTPRRRAALKETRSVKLPANQLALADALVRTGKTVVAVVVGGVPVDMGFDGKLSAVLVAPFTGNASFDALTRVLSGEVSPSGKLANTYYENTDELFLVQKNYKDAGRNKVGPFLGYRRYDAAGAYPKYPFGFGLSYTKFGYSALDIVGHTVRFTVTNLGERDGVETAQIYLGKPGIRPKKELQAFVKIPLQAGESKTVSVELPERAFASYFESSGSREAEGGTFTVYVCASVKDVRLKGTVLSEGRAPEGGREKLSDYLQSVSNIMFGGYALKEARKTAIRNWRERKFLRFGALVAAALILVADFVFAAVGFARLGIGDSGVAWVAVLNIVLAIAAAALVAERATRNRASYAAYPESKEKIADAKDVSDASYETFFTEELARRDDEDDEPAPAAEVPQYFDESMTFSVASAELAVFCAERGVPIDADSARAVFASLCSSRCILLRGSPVKRLMAFAAVLCEYFGTPFHSDLAERYETLEDLFYTEGENGVRMKSGAHRALLSASEMTPYVQFATLRRVKLSALEKYFAPVAERLKGARAGTLAAFDDFGKKTVYELPPNLWFLLVPSEGQPLGELPASLADVVSVLNLEIGTAQEPAEKTLVRALSYFQLSEMARSAKLSFETEESDWKKIDRLEEKVSAAASYHIGNRLWLALENYASVYMACGGSPGDALDNVLAARLLCRISAAVGDDTFSDLLEDAFPEDALPRCKRLIKPHRTESKENDQDDSEGDTL